MSVMSEAGKSGGAQVDAAGYTPGQVRLLKIVVIALGLAIVFCLALIIATIFYQASQTQQVASPAPATAGDVSAAPPVMSLAAEPGQSVAGVTLDGDRLAVHLKGVAGEEIAIVDLTTGSILRRIAVTPRQSKDSP